MKPKNQIQQRKQTWSGNYICLRNTGRSGQCDLERCAKLTSFNKSNVTKKSAIADLAHGSAIQWRHLQSHNE